MRTISKNLKRRLEAQAQEANFQGFDKVASQVAHQANNNPLRDDLEDYVYSSDDLRSDVENLLWAAAIRTQDYFGKTADAKEIGDVIESLSSDLISSIGKKIGGAVIGPYEPLVPGEKRMIVEIDQDVT